MTGDGSANRLRPVYLLTDFGLEDAYVGVMKGVLRSRQPAVIIDDLCHLIDPQDLRQAAYQLFTALPYLPRDALTVVVVDPGVGTSRRILVHRWGSRLFVSPDNGVVVDAFRYHAAWRGVDSLTLGRAALAREVISALRPASPFPSTFDGRDAFMPLAALYAPVAARLPSFTDVEIGPGDVLPRANEVGELVAAILLYDRFGNAITNLSLTHFPGSPPFRRRDALLWTLHWRGQKVPFYETYASAPAERPFALCNSSGLLELAIKNGSLRDYEKSHPADAGHEVRLTPNVSSP